MKNNYLRCYLVIIIMLFFCITLMGCGEKGNPVVVSADQSSVSIEETIVTIDQPLKDQESDKEQKSFSFVDAFGKRYEATIDNYAIKNDYDESCFSMYGSMRYEDSRYFSRSGVDVSHHQGGIDWNAVKQAGYDFAFIRIGYRRYQVGTVNPDKEFKENIENAKKAGVDVGVYFFSQAINDDEVKEEAQFVIDQLKDYSINLPVVYDQESILDDTARTDNVSAEQFTRNAVLFCDMISKAGFEPMIYCNMKWEAFIYDMSKLSKYPFWYADYEPKPQSPYAFRFWQYSNKATVPGIIGEADVNIELIRKK